MTAATGINIHQCMPIYPPEAMLWPRRKGTSIPQLRGENNWRKRYYCSIATFQSFALRKNARAGLEKASPD